LHWRCAIAVFECARLPADTLTRDESNAWHTRFQSANERGDKRRVVLPITIERHHKAPAPQRHHCAPPPTGRKIACGERDAARMLRHQLIKL
jgi:hypothetical protein